MDCQLVCVEGLMAYNGSRLGEVGDFENETLELLLNLNWNTNVEFTTEPPILPNRC
mgnify:CR=1 FL=1